MKTIYKFNLETTDTQTLLIPKGGEILSVQVQYGYPKLWVLVDPNEPLEERTIQIFETGHPVSCDTGIERKFISTYQLMNGNLVFHVFEQIK